LCLSQFKYILFFRILLFTIKKCQKNFHIGKSL